MSDGMRDSRGVGKPGYWVVPQRSHTDGKPFYCITCGLGWNEYQACEEVDCELETEADAKARYAQKDTENG